MIYDSIDNFERYVGMMPGIAEGLRFIRSATLDLQLGRHELPHNCYANVDEYCTKVQSPVGFEAHREYIDIQFLLSGEERILVRPLAELRCTTPYDAHRDVAFFAHEEPATEVVLGKGRFVILFPDEAHEPQLCLAEPRDVKKIVVKVKCK